MCEALKKRESCNARKYYVCHTKKYNNLQPESKVESKIITETKINLMKLGK